VDVDDTDAATAVTITAAAAQIGCLRPFIYSLINRKKLTGPEYPARPPRNAPRIYQSSIDDYLEQRTARHTPRGLAATARLAATDADILERLDELTRLVQQDLRKQRSRRDAIANQVASLMKLTASSASDFAQSAKTHAKALNDLHKLFDQLSELADNDNDTVDTVLAGYREIVTTLLQRTGNG